MRHVKSVSKKAVPARAYVWEWFINVKADFAPGVIMTEGKQNYVNALWNHDGSINPTNVDDLNLFL